MYLFVRIYILPIYPAGDMLRKLFVYLAQKVSAAVAAGEGDNPVAAAEASGGGVGGWLSHSVWYVENRTGGVNGDFSGGNDNSGGGDNGGGGDNSGGGENSGCGDGADLERLRPSFERLFQRYGLQDCPGWLRSKGLNDPDSTPK
jgi:hypothetical protein